jgi:heme-degrading monooxygenase HmoA
MQARVTRVQYQPGKGDEGIKIYRELVADAKKQAGFKGALLLINRNNKQSISITLWDQPQQEQATGSGSSHVKNAEAKLKSQLAGGPSFETFEVAYQE